MSYSPASTLMHIKRRAKHIKKTAAIEHSAALDAAAKESGFDNFRHARNQLASPPQDAEAFKAAVSTSPAAVFQFLSAFVDRNTVFGDRALCLMSAALAIAHKHGQALNVETLKQFLHSQTLINASNDPSVNAESRDKILTYLRMVPGWSEQFLQPDPANAANVEVSRARRIFEEQHGYAASYFSRPLTASISLPPQRALSRFPELVTFPNPNALDESFFIAVNRSPR